MLTMGSGAEEEEEESGSEARHVTAASTTRRVASRRAAMHFAIRHWKSSRIRPERRPDCPRTRRTICSCIVMACKHSSLSAMARSAGSLSARGGGTATAISSPMAEPASLGAGASHAGRLGAVRCTRGDAVSKPDALIGRSGACAARGAARTPPDIGRRPAAARWP